MMNLATADNQLLHDAHLQMVTIFQMISATTDDLEPQDLRIVKISTITVNE